MHEKHYPRVSSGGQLVPFTFPATHSVLWDHRETGPATANYFAHERNPLIILEEKTLRLMYSFAKDSTSTSRDGSEFICMLIGSVCSESDGSGITINIDTLSTNRHPLSKTLQTKDLCPGQLTIICSVTMDNTKSMCSSTEFLNSIELVANRCHDSTPIDLSHFLSLRANCSCHSNADGFAVQIDFDAIIASTGFKLVPIGPLVLVPTALSKNLAGPLSISEVQGEPKSGFITMDHTRKILLLLESDPKVKSLPIVGIWTSGISNITDTFIWASCMRYVFSKHIADRVCVAPDPFLVVVFSPLHSQPEFYDCTIVQGSMSPGSEAGTVSGASGENGRRGLGSRELNFTLSSSHDVIHINKENVGRAQSPVEMDVLPVTAGGAKSDIFRAALDEFRSKRRQSDQKETAQCGSTRADEIVPRSFPVPHHSVAAMGMIQPSVPEVSLLFDSVANDPIPFSTAPSYQPINDTSLRHEQVPKSSTSVVPQYSCSYSFAVKPAQASLVIANSSTLNLVQTGFSSGQNGSNPVHAKSNVNPCISTSSNSGSNLMQYFNTSMASITSTGQQQSTDLYPAPRPQEFPHEYRPILQNGKQIISQTMGAPPLRQNYVPVSQIPQNFQNCSPPGAPTRMNSGGTGASWSSQNQVPIQGSRLQAYVGSQMAAPGNGQVNGFQSTVYPHSASGPVFRLSNGLPSQQVRQNIPMRPQLQQQQLQQQLQQQKPLQQQQLQQQWQQPRQQQPQHQPQQQMLLNATAQRQFISPQPVTRSCTPLSIPTNVNRPQMANIQQCSTSQPTSNTTVPSIARQLLSSTITPAVSQQSYNQLSPPVFDSRRTADARFRSPVNYDSRPIPVNTQGSTSPSIAHISGSTDSGFPLANDSTGVVDGAGSFIPEDVYRRLSEQDAELKSLRLQLQQLLQIQSNPLPIQTSSDQFQSAGQSADRKLGQVELRGRESGLSARESNAVRTRTSVAVNTSFYWPAATDNHIPSTFESPTNNSQDANRRESFGTSLNGEGLVGADDNSCLSNDDRRRSGKHSDGSDSRQTGGSRCREDRTAGGRGTGSDTITFADMNLTSENGDACAGDSHADDSNASEMIMDMPGYTSLSPDKIEHGYGEVGGSDRSPMLGESVSMYEEQGYIAKMPQYKELEEEEERETLTQSEIATDVQQAVSDQHVFYHNLIDNINKLLMKNSASAGDENEQNFQESGDRQLSLKQPRPNDTSRSSEQFEEIQMADIVERTKDQLRMMGVNMDQVELAEKSSSNSADQTMCFLDPSMLPRVNYVSMLLDTSDADLSLDADALAMKYLRDDQLSELARTRQRNPRRQSDKDTALNRVMSAGGVNHRSDVSMYGLPVGHMSFASRQYLIKFGLLNDEEENSDGDKVGKRKKALPSKTSRGRRAEPGYNAPENGSDNQLYCDYDSMPAATAYRPQSNEPGNMSSYSDTVYDQTPVASAALRHCHSDGDSFQSWQNNWSCDQNGYDNKTSGNPSSGGRQPMRHSYDGCTTSTPYQRLQQPHNDPTRYNHGVVNSGPRLSDHSRRPHSAAGSPAVILKTPQTMRNMLPAADRTLEYPDDIIVDHNGTDPVSNDVVFVGRRGGGVVAANCRDDVGVRVDGGFRAMLPATRVLDLERLKDMPKLL